MQRPRAPGPMPEQLQYIAPSTTPRPTIAFLDRPLRPYLPEDNLQTIDIPEQGQPRAESIYDAMDSQLSTLDTKLHILLTSKD